MNKPDQNLLNELKDNQIKHTPENIIRIAKTADGKIVFLEKGDSRSGLEHILQEHSLRFLKQGITTEQLPDAIMIAITQGQVVGVQGKKHQTPRYIYQYTFNNEVKYMAITIADNGYIVGANPKRKDDIPY